VKLDILVRRSQVSLLQLRDLLSEFFELDTTSGRRGEWIEGRRHSSFDDVVPMSNASVRVEIPVANREEKGRIDEWLSQYSSPSYRIRLSNVALETMLSIIDGMEERGLDIGFVEPQGGRFSALRGEMITWPGDPEARRSTAIRIHKLSREIPYERVIDLDFFILSTRNITRRKLRTVFLVAVLSLVCANFIYHINFSISGEGVSVLVPEQWELPFAAGIMALITFMNLMEISLHERKIEIGTIRALGCETTTTMLIFASEGMILGTLGAISGYVMVILVALSIRLSGLNPALDLVAVAGPGKGIMGLFLGLFIGVVGTVPLIFPMIWRPPERCL